MRRAGSILTGQPGEHSPFLCIEGRNPSVMIAFPFDTHLPSSVFHPSPRLIVSPCDCHHTLLCFISVPFPLFLLKLSSNLHIVLLLDRVSRRAAVSRHVVIVLQSSLGLAWLGLGCDLFLAKAIAVSLAVVIVSRP